ncbi:MAG: hypothetical protein LH473_00390 [Chitinophagales bacterium]|nr:hypothetical protein [Chitinophagales bacterium]
MQIFLKQHRQIVIKLMEAKVEFILIGGYAVIYHGYPRTTDDLDIWLKPDNRNKEKLLPVLQSINLDEDDICEPLENDFTQPVVFQIGDPPERIDFITRVAGLKFDEASISQVYFTIESLRIPVLHLDHLIINKLLSGCLKIKPM